jgi:hypothetical protein
VNIDNEDLRRFDMHSDTFYSIFDRSIFLEIFKFKGAQLPQNSFSAFEQNIKSSTTRKLTCLDHIYTQHLNAQQAGVVPIYYSYHDMTYIFSG